MSSSSSNGPNDSTAVAAVVKAFACKVLKEPLRRFDYPAVSLERYPHFIDVAISHCGCCHSDLHTVRGEWGSTNLPCVPGHEIIGHVRAVGSRVTKFHVGDRVAVGTIVDSCGDCAYCNRGEEQHCNECVFTYGTHVAGADRVTYGGYADRIQLNERFAYKLPASFDSASAAPLMCAGVTTYAPLVHFGVKPGDHVGVIGLGGLGHLAVQFSVAMGCEVSVVSHSESKESLAMSLGAKKFINSNDAKAMKAHRDYFDFLITTVSANVDVVPYLEMLRLDGKFCAVAIPEKAIYNIPPQLLIHKRISVCGSLVAGRVITQSMLDFCELHHIKSMVEELPMTEENVNVALDRLEKNLPRFRTVLTNNVN